LHQTLKKKTGVTQKGEGLGIVKFRQGGQEKTKNLAELKEKKLKKLQKSGMPNVVSQEEDPPNKGVTEDQG